jgi:hypothetical protein
VNPKAKRFAQAFSWSAIFAIVITGAVHALAVTLPEHLSSRGARRPSVFEQRANAFSSVWLENSPVLPAVVAAGCFVLIALLWLALSRPKASSPPDSGAG